MANPAPCTSTNHEGEFLALDKSYLKEEYRVFVGVYVRNTLPVRYLSQLQALFFLLKQVGL